MTEAGWRLAKQHLKCSSFHPVVTVVVLLHKYNSLGDALYRTVFTHDKHSQVCYNGSMIICVLASHRQTYV